MIHETRYAADPVAVKTYDTQQLRAAFLIEDIFHHDTVRLCYSHYDRLIVGGVQPVTKDVPLDTFNDLKASYFLERRELGIINVGGTGTVLVDGIMYTLENKEALYVGRGAKQIVFQPAPDKPLFYFNSAPAHTTYPTRHVSHTQAETVQLGSAETSNHRTIRKLLVNSVLPTCQLQMGVTELKPGSVWNTMPPHTHDRRMEAYFYFDLPTDHAVCHFMGQPTETRHLFVKNHQAVISPPWSIHSGAGTSNYTFIWGMAGENLDYGDMDAVTPWQLR